MTEKRRFNMMAVCACSAFFYISYALTDAPQACGKEIRVYAEHEKERRPEGSSVLSDIEWDAISAGDVLLLDGDSGIYTGPVVIKGRGSDGSSIAIRGGDGKMPVIEGPVYFSGAMNVIFEKIEVKNSARSGINIKDQSSGITISNCVIRDNELGVCIEESAGMSNRIYGNEIYGNKLHGIGADAANCEPGKETVIELNKVHHNGYHGIEINGCHYIIQNNEAHDNGFASTGTSGIHIYAKEPHGPYGDFNTVRYNVSHHNIDKGGTDGNGIQLDQWCDRNEVCYNLCFENDGAGISIFDSSEGVIYNNTLFNNMRDRTRPYPARGEIAMSSDYTKNIDHVKNVKIVNNIAVATDPMNYAIYADEAASRGNQAVTGNLFFHIAGADFYKWGAETGTAVAEFNKIFNPMADNLYGDPMFLKKDPREPKDFRLRAGSPRISGAVYTGQERDLFGSPIQWDRRPNIGAVENYN